MFGKTTVTSKLMNLVLKVETRPQVEEASMWSSNIFGNERDNVGEANFAGPCLLETRWRDS